MIMVNGELSRACGLICPCPVIGSSTVDVNGYKQENSGQSGGRLTRESWGKKREKREAGEGEKSLHIA